MKNVKMTNRKECQRCFLFAFLNGGREDAGKFRALERQRLYGYAQEGFVRWRERLCRPRADLWLAESTANVPSGKVFVHGILFRARDWRHYLSDLHSP